MQQKTEEKLRQKVADSPATFEDAKEAFDEALQTVEEKLLEDLSQEEMEARALQFLRASDIEQDRTTYGESMDLQILTVGARQMRWSDGDGGKKDVVIAYGVIHAPGRRLPAEDGGEGPEIGFSVFILDSAKGIDPAEAMQKFSALNTIVGNFSVSRSSDLSTIGSSDTVDTDVYRCEASSRTTFEEADPAEMDLPTDRDAKNKVLRSRIPQATLSDAATDAAKVLSAYDPESGYPHEFGADLRRINATIVDYYIPDDRSWGRMTVLDDTVLEDELQGTPVMEEDAQTPGMTVWADPDYHINYGRKSQVDLYCSISTSDDGQVSARAVGVVPILPMPMDDGDGGSNAQTNAKETEI